MVKVKIHFYVDRHIL